MNFNSLSKILVGIFSVVLLSFLVIKVAPAFLGTNFFINRPLPELVKEDISEIADYAITAFNNGDFTNAITLYERALKEGDFTGENRTTLLLNLAIAYEAIGDTTGAQTTYALILKDEPEQSVLWHLIHARMALISEYLEIPSALSHLEEILKMDTSNFDALTTLSLIYMGEYGTSFQDNAKALDYNLQSLQISPDNDNVKLNLATTYLELNQYTQAETLLKNVLTNREDFIPASYLLMKTLYLEGKISEAKLLAKKLLSIYEGFEEDDLVKEILAAK